jgi:RNA polymerase sigma factor (sigma-70 family)
MATGPEALPSATARAADARSDRDSRTRLDQMARRYYAPLVSFFRKRTGNAAQVQDLVQQVFLRLAQHHKLDAIHNPDGYIFQTAANALRDHARRNEVRARFERQNVGTATDAQSDISPERVLQGRESIAQLTAALRELPERTRDIFMLRTLEGLKHVEIARLYGISTRAIEKHLAKALAHVSRALDRDNEQTDAS